MVQIKLNEFLEDCKETTDFQSPIAVVSIQHVFYYAISTKEYTNVNV